MKMVGPLSAAALEQHIAAKFIPRLIFEPILDSARAAARVELTKAERELRALFAMDTTS